MTYCNMTQPYRMTHCNILVAVKRNGNNFNVDGLLVLREKCLYSEFFWTEYVQTRARKTPHADTFHTVYMFIAKIQNLNVLTR